MTRPAGCLASREVMTVSADLSPKGDTKAVRHGDMLTGMWMCARVLVSNDSSHAVSVFSSNWLLLDIHRRTRADLFFPRNMLCTCKTNERRLLTHVRRRATAPNECFKAQCASAYKFTNRTAQPHQHQSSGMPSGALACQPAKRSHLQHQLTPPMTGGLYSGLVDVSRADGPRPMILKDTV